MAAAVAGGGAWRGRRLPVACAAASLLLHGAAATAILLWTGHGSGVRSTQAWQGGIEVSLAMDGMAGGPEDALQPAPRGDFAEAAPLVEPTDVAAEVRAEDVPALAPEPILSDQVVAAVDAPVAPSPVATPQAPVLAAEAAERVPAEPLPLDAVADAALAETSPTLVAAAEPPPPQVLPPVPAEAAVAAPALPRRNVSVPATPARAVPASAAQRASVPRAASADATRRPTPGTPAGSGARPAGGPAQAAAAPPAPAADEGPVLIVNPRFRLPPLAPAYPPRARDLGQEGEVVVRARLDPLGTPEEVVVYRSSGFELLDRAALAAVRRWAFEPGRRGGAPVPAWVQVPVRFALR